MRRLLIRLLIPCVASTVSSVAVADAPAGSSTPAPRGPAGDAAPDRQAPSVADASGERVVPVEPVADGAPDPDASAIASPVEAPAVIVPAATHAELIEVTGARPPAAGTIAIDAQVARRTAGTLGEPFRVLASLPGVTTSVAASGYPVIRGTLPGESRFELDGIEIPLLYHLLLGTQVVHPSFIGDIQLRAGGHGADQGHLIGGLVSMTAVAADQPRTELRANLVELGAFRSQPLSATTAIAVAARVGTLDGAAKLYAPDTTLHYVDQQTRLVHRLGNGDVLTLTSLGAYDYVKLPPDPGIETLQLGFHRLDARWTRGTAGRQLRAGVQTELDSMRSVLEYALDPGSDMFPGQTLPEARRRGSHAYGARAYSDGELRVARWLTVRGGAEAHQRMLANSEPLFDVIRSQDPMLGQASSVDSEGAWAAIELRLGALTVKPGLRADRYHAVMATAAVRHASVDPRLAITGELPNGGQVELAGGAYSAPPQVSIVERSIAIGPLPTTEGTGFPAGLSRGHEAQASLRTPLPVGLTGNLAAYYRDTDYAIDFGMVDKPFPTQPLCAPRFSASEMPAYHHVDVRAMGVEAMVQRPLGREITGWVSYSLGKIDRDLGFLQLPHEFDQRHTVTATAQWERGGWRLGATGHMHTGRPMIYPAWMACSDPDAPPIDVVYDPSQLRRPGATWRLDVRAERAFQLAGWRMRLSVELQNASLSHEVTGYGLTASDPNDPATYRVGEKTMFLPLPMVGLDVEL